MKLLSKLETYIKKRTINEPNVFKPMSYNINLSKMIEMEKTNNNKELTRDILLMKQGLEGERNVYFELKNSSIPMIIMHDVRIELEAQVAQFDFIVITHKNLYSLEVKNLNGDMNISKDGEFIRIINNKEEGMFSPLSQNERHLKVLRELIKRNYFDITCPLKSLVVLTNSKTVLNFDNDYYKESICRLDQLIDRIKSNEENSKDENTENWMKKIGNLLMINDTPIEFNLAKKYPRCKVKEDRFVGLQRIEVIRTYNNASIESTSNKEVSYTENKVSSDEIADNINPKVKELRKFRMDMANKYNVKPYMIFNNKQMEELLLKNPKTINELLTVQGFNKVIVDKIGEDLLKIVNFKNLVEVKLREYRTYISRKENTKPYFVFSNKQMEDLIAKLPKNKEELLKVQGFGEVKVNKYGDKILEIINKAIIS